MPRMHPEILLPERPFTQEDGFSLVEVTVAAAILGLIISALAVMIGNSEILRVKNDHYRQARIIAQEEMEHPARHFLSVGTTPNPPPTNDFIDLDFAEGPHAVSANRRVTASPVVQSAVFGDGVLIPYQVIQTKIIWQESGKSPSVTLSKRVVVLK